MISDHALRGTRPLCAYPEVSRHRGNGDTQSFAGFECANPARAAAADCRYDFSLRGIS